MTFNEIVTSPWFAIAGFVVGILGVIVSTVIYILARRVRRLTYVTRSQNLIRSPDKPLGKLQVTYDGQVVAGATITRILIWNSGTEIILGSEIIPADPLCICINDEAKFLDAAILHQNDATSAVTLTSNADNRVLVNFDHLEVRCGAIIQLIHTGLNGLAVSVGGHVRGGVKVGRSRIINVNRLISAIPPLAVLNRWLKLSPHRLRGPLSIVFFAVPFVVLFAMLFEPPSPSTLQPASPWTLWGIFILYGFMFWFLGFALLKSRPPKGFESFDESL